MEKKGLRTKGFNGFRVSNANGKLILVDHLVEQFGVRLQICMFREDFYLYPLQGHPHIIMGVQWLFGLGDIDTNYQRLTMSFEADGKSHTLQGMQDDCPQGDNKRLEMIEWSLQNKEPGGATLQPLELGGVTLGHGGVTLGHGGAGGPTSIFQESYQPTSSM